MRGSGKLPGDVRTTEERRLGPGGAGGRGPGARAALVGAAVLALLALVAVAAASRHGGDGGGTGSSPDARLLSYLLSAYLVLGAATAAFVVFVLVTQRHALPARRRANRDLRSLLFFAFALALAFAIYGLRSSYLDGSRTRTAPGLTTPPSATVPDRGRSRTPDLGFRWEPAALLAGAALAAVAVVVVRRRRRPSPRTPLPLAEELGDVLDDALDDLRAERDARRAVVAAYARMESLLAARGLPRRPFEAPFEYLGRVLVELRASATSVFELTALFERAKFSHHAVDHEMKDEAIGALETVRDELRSAA